MVFPLGNGSLGPDIGSLFLFELCEHFDFKAGREEVFNAEGGGEIKASALLCQVPVGLAFGLAGVIYEEDAVNGNELGAEITMKRKGPKGVFITNEIVRLKMELGVDVSWVR